MKACLIDPFAKTVIELDIEEPAPALEDDQNLFYSEIFKFVDANEAVDVIDLWEATEGHNTFTIGDELIHDRDATFRHTELFRLEGLTEPVGGKAVLVNQTSGHVIDPQELAELVTWVR